MDMKDPAKFAMIISVFAHKYLPLNHLDSMEIVKQTMVEPMKDLILFLKTQLYTFPL